MVTVTVGDARFELRGDVSVLVGMERLTLFPRPIPVGCRNGGCGKCKVRVVSGEYRTGKMSRAHISEAEQAEGWVLACRLYPESDVVLELPPEPAPAE